MLTVASELRESTTTTSEKQANEARQSRRFLSSLRTGMQTETGRVAGAFAVCRLARAPKHRERSLRCLCANRSTSSHSAFSCSAYVDWLGQAFEPGSSSRVRFLTNLAGFPTTTVQGATFFVTTARAPTIAPSPIVTPGPRKASAHIHASSAMWIGGLSRGIAGSL